MTIQDYLTAYDQWLSQHIHAAMKSGKDLAFRDRRVNCALKLDDDGAAWDYLLLEPGDSPPAGYVWSVYRLQGVGPSAPPASVPSAPLVHQRRRSKVLHLAEAVFGWGRAPAKPKAPVLHAVR